MKRELVVGGVLVFVALFILNAKFDLIGQFTSSLIGFTTLSLSQASFVSSNQFFSSEAWILTVAQGGLGQSATGTITAQEISDSSGTTPQKDFDITIDYAKQTCQYDLLVEHTSLPLYTYSAWIYNGDCSPAGLDANCPNRVFGGTLYGFPAPCYCVERLQKSGAISPFIQNPLVRTISEISVSNTETIDSFNFDSSGEMSGFIGDNVYLQWNGNLIKDRCENQAPYYMYYYNDLYLSAWKIGLKDNYDQYVATHNALITQSEINSCVDAVTEPTNTCLQRLVLTVNEASNKASEQVSFGYIQSAFSQDNAVLEVPLDSFVQIPTYTFIVKADYLTINQPVAVPKIVNVNSLEFKAGEIGEITATINNVGDMVGNVNVWAVCNDPFTYVETTKTFSVYPNQPQLVRLKITASTTTPIESVCTVYAQSLDLTDSATVLVKVNPQQVCSPNVEYCDGDVRVSCNPTGTGYMQLEDCALQDKFCKYLTSTTTECSNEGNVDGGDNFLLGVWDLLNDFWKGIFGEGIVGGIISIFATIGTLLLAVFLFVVFIFLFIKIGFQLIVRWITK